MAEKFKIGDHVTWNSNAGQVGGKTDHIAMHKGSALKKASE